MQGGGHEAETMEKRGNLESWVFKQDKNNELVGS